MHDLMNALRDLVLCDVESVVKKGKIEAAEYEKLGMAVDIIKDIDTIDAMETYGYETEDMPSRYMRSGRMMPRYNSYGYDDGYSWGDGMYSGMRGRDAKTGRYMSRDDETMAKLNRMMGEAKTEAERNTIARMMDEFRR